MPHREDGGHLDSKTYSFKDLAAKYNHFSAPYAAVHIGGKELNSYKDGISWFEVNMDAGGNAGDCHIEFRGGYNYEKSEWPKALTDALVIGAPLEVRAGYGRASSGDSGTALIFYGYVEEYSYTLTNEEGEGGDVVTITGMDALGYLMNIREIVDVKVENETLMQDVLKGIFDKVPSSILKGRQVLSANKSFLGRINANNCTAWRLLHLLASRCGVQLSCINGVLCFDDLQGTTAPVTTMGPEELEYCSRRVSLKDQPGEIEVSGRDAQSKPVSAKADSYKGAAGSGKTAKELAGDLLKNIVIKERSEFIRTKEEAQQIAQSRFDQAAMRFAELEARCIGIPEITAGRYIKIEGFNKRLDGSYFLTKVRHYFDPGKGYMTEFTGEAGKATI